MDYTSIHPSCINLSHLIDLHLWKGAPQNHDADRPIQILVNHGYVVGFCPDRLQPAWSAYRVAHAEDDVDYDRPIFYYDDMRLQKEHRIGRKTFGKIGGIKLNVGHMTPNEVINRQFGRLAQIETFLMSNMSPQYESVNQGVWLKLEDSIRMIKDEKGKDHVWAIVGPIFGEEPTSINRRHGKYVPIPDAYFCIVVDPHTYPYDTPSKVDIDCFRIPQTAPRKSSPKEYPSTLEEIEKDTKLKFFDSWGRAIPIERMASVEEIPPSESRLMKILHKKCVEDELKIPSAKKAYLKIDSIEGLIKKLKTEATHIQIQGSALTDEQKARLKTIQHTISWLIRARDIQSPPSEPTQLPTLITYKIASDMGDKLQIGARTACNFWNRFIQPKYSIVIRLETFTQNSPTIAWARKPYWKGKVCYGEVGFNTKSLAKFSADEIAGTITHEIGHSLGIGWDKWNSLYDQDTGLFTPKAIGELADLAQMEVERDGGDGTALSHWDEYRFDKELMTGIQDKGMHVLPVTIDLMEILGHTVNENLKEKTSLAKLMQEAASMLFSRQDEALRIDLEYYEKTEIFEKIPHELTFNGD